MSRFGQLSLQRVIIDYSAYSGADGLRHAFAREIPQFKKDYPSVVIEVRPRSQADTVTCVYKDGSEYSFPVVNLSSMALYQRLSEMAQTCNDRTVHFNSANAHFQNTSVQGAWNPFLFAAERHEERQPLPKWDRKLTSDEWDYYVEKYSQQLKDTRAQYQDELTKATALPDQMTKDIAERWQKHIRPNLQSDMEENLEQMKKAATSKGKFPDPVSAEEMKAFAAPDVQVGGGDVLRSLRHKELRKTEKWWQDRKDQLKPPK